MANEGTIQRWIEETVSGDRTAVQKLILVYHSRLRKLAAHRLPASLRGRLEPEDVLQQVYVDVVRRAGEFKYHGPDSFFYWMVRILNSRLVDAQRRLRAAVRDVFREVGTTARLSGYEKLGARAVDTLTPSRVVARIEAQSLLMAALAGLSPDHRIVLELRYLKDLPLAEVAAKMNRSPGAVQMLCGRALRRLRAAIVQISGIRP